MKILICYATTDGQTRKISRFCLDQLFALGHSVELLNADDGDEVELAGFDAAVLAASVHAGHLQKGLAEFAAANAEALNGMPTLLLQVSLSAAGGDADELADLDRITHDFCSAAGWTPGEIYQVAGAFRFTQYDFFRSWAMRYIAAQNDQKVDPGADREYTDWQALADKVHAWAAAPITPA